MLNYKRAAHFSKYFALHPKKLPKCILFLVLFYEKIKKKTIKILLSIIIIIKNIRMIIKPDTSGFLSPPHWWMTSTSTRDSPRCDWQIPGEAGLPCPSDPAPSGRPSASRRRGGPLRESLRSGRGREESRHHDDQHQVQEPHPGENR